MILIACVFMCGLSVAQDVEKDVYTSINVKGVVTASAVKINAGVSTTTPIGVDSTGQIVPIGISVEKNATSISDSATSASSSNLVFYNPNTGVVLTAPDGGTWRLTIKNDGTILSQKVTIP